MPRISRESYQGLQVFHIMTQGIDKENIFNTSRYKNEYIKLMKKLKKDYKVNVIAYCIMDNHSHMIIQVENIDNMTKFMHKLNTNYGIYYNKNLQRIGYVFRNRFNIQPILNIQHLYNCILYVHNNPVKAGICGNAEQYKYSSYYSFPRENRIIFNRTFKNIEEYRVEHKNYKQNDYFMDEDRDTDYMIKTDISSYLNINNKKIVDLKVNNELLVPIVKKIKKVYNVSNRKIAGYLDISYEKIRYILK